ncbi:MAG: DNA-formamidopyrimidine glycosylase [Candidatus Komeilibacteria bacterium RIFOXYC1_FULL_37_11]|uniref:DNA-formamidopyrimidine glycosylase n=1 Tax=Candidatus Komeilibacteria bacterium RIFOXYC1_FULL_37_11 TaxID=1798555 RepID=A0A1G2BZF5_9BACT|nr:MAG: DNA-formamidopyrimidine glycosylase [Candidatus Komeilibacteria bacterium RIFOXYC1_FULL_37_11]OGY95914.1 MAG: DNA-formamidopyrimidine glycosylase [Candidatus Komeilibacteria bacterium RIFOXYD1_FULL_37_29]
MPELPEVETIRRGLSERIVNKKIVDIEIKKPRLIRNKLADFKALVYKNHILSIDRVGKLLILNLADSNFLLIHLKMTGQLIYSFNSDIVAGGHNFPSLESLPNKYSHIIFRFSDGSSLFFNDMRQFGYMQIVDAKGHQKVRSKFGIEPASRDFTWKNFQSIIKSRRGVLKAFLLDQRFIAGIGNIYADEICWRARLLPQRRVESLSPTDVKRLYQASQFIIKKAIAKKGTTFRDYRDVDNKKGNFIQYLKVYGRSGEKCLVCKNKIQKIRLAGRGTHLCSHCQK